MNIINNIRAGLVIAGLALYGLSVPMAHAVAMYQGSASDAVEITSMQTDGVIIDEADWLDLLAIDPVGSLSTSADFDPDPPNTASATAGTNAVATTWSVGADVDGTVTVPGFAESSALAELEVAITNTSATDLLVTLERTKSLVLSYSLDTMLETLDSLSGFTTGLGVIALTPIPGPDSDSIDSGVNVSVFEFDLAPGETDSFTLRAEVEGRVSAAAPEPATLALMGLGLAGIGYQRRRKFSS